MKEATLTKICFLTATIGIIAFFIASASFQYPRVNVSELNEGMDFVIIQGRVRSKYTSKTGTTFIRLDDGTGVIKVVVFKDVELSDVEVGDVIEVLGRVQRYRGELEVIARRLNVVKG